jgi:hypothetical protein
LFQQIEPKTQNYKTTTKVQKLPSTQQQQHKNTNNIDTNTHSSSSSYSSITNHHVFTTTNKHPMFKNETNVSMT